MRLYIELLTQKNNYSDSPIANDRSTITKATQVIIYTTPLYSPLCTNIIGGSFASNREKHYYSSCFSWPVSCIPIIIRRTTYAYARNLWPCY